MSTIATSLWKEYCPIRRYEAEARRLRCCKLPCIRSEPKWSHKLYQYAMEDDMKGESLFIRRESRLDRPTDLSSSSKKATLARYLNEEPDRHTVRTQNGRAHDMIDKGP